MLLECGQKIRPMLVAALALAAGCSSVSGLEGAAGEAINSAEPSQVEAAFSWFRYSGEDQAAPNPGPDEYLNPILSGFYPDPSITRVGDDFYLVHSTFAWFPGIPVLHSRDLVNWTQIGNAIDREGMLDFGGLGLSRAVFAPTIEHHRGRFHIANTCVDCGGNFIITAENPAGPWSQPVWLPEIGGIDPSLFFDDDGKVYILNNDEPPGPALYDGHRAIWIRQVEPETFKSKTTAIPLVDGGVRPEEKPIWIEGPHIYKRDGWYYLCAAEGGTAVNHSQVVLRSRDVLGPYTPYADNPILTQRDLDPARDNPITSVGHVDLVELDGDVWWAVFLGVRPYEADYYNTGRETFLLPVDWRGGWPRILARGASVPRVVARPALPAGAPPKTPLTGDFAYEEQFESPTLGLDWLSPRGPADAWLATGDGALRLTAQPDGLGDPGRPAFIARRQQHLFAEASTAVSIEPDARGEAGLAAFQNDAFFFALGVGADSSGAREVRLRRRAGEDSPRRGDTIAAARLSGGGPVRLRIVAREEAYDFQYAEGDGRWKVLAEGEDGRILSTKTALGFVGAVFGLYAESN